MTLTDTRIRQHGEKLYRALAELDRISYRPTLPSLAKIAGVSVEQVRHALRVTEREMKDYFK